MTVTPSPQSVVVRRADLEEVRDLLMERIYGSAARSPGHNARLAVEAMLAAAPAPSSLAGGEVTMGQRAFEAIRDHNDNDAPGSMNSTVQWSELSEDERKRWDWAAKDDPHLYGLAALSPTPEAPCDLSDAIDQFISDAIANGAVEINGDDTIQWCKPALEQALISSLAGCGYQIAALSPEAPAREKHYGDPCIRCGVGHDNVPPGPCQGDGITISRERARAVLDYLKNGRGPAGWPTQLWVEVQHFIANIEAALSPEAQAREGAIDLIADLTVLASCDDMEVSHNGGDTNVGDVARRCLSALTPRHEAPAEPCFECGSTERTGTACKPCNPEITDPNFGHEAPAEGAGEVEAIARLMCRQHYGDRGYSTPGILNVVESDWPAWKEKAEEVIALRARSSAPEAREGEAVAWRRWSEGLPHQGGYWSLSSKEAGDHAIATGSMDFEPLYTHPAAPSADKLREALVSVSMAVQLGEAHDIALAALKAEGAK